MSVKTLPNNQLRVECDGRHDRGVCQNHFELPNEQIAIKAAEQWLERHGWRTKMDGYVPLTYCPHCAAKMREFSPRFKAEDPGPQKRRGHSAEGKQRMSESAKNRQQRSDARR